MACTKIDSAMPEKINPLDWLRFAEKIASRFRSDHMTWEDLRQVAFEGLLHACKDFDLSWGVFFSTYARKTIRGYLATAVTRNFRLGMYGHYNEHSHVVWKLRRAAQRTRISYADAGRIVSPTRGTWEDGMYALAMLGNHELSLQMEIKHSNPHSTRGHVPLAETIKAEGANEVAYDGLVRTAWERVLDKVRESLNNRELAILDERLLAAEPKDLAELGRRWSISRERVRQLECHVREMLKSAAQRAELLPKRKA